MQEPSARFWKIFFEVYEALPRQGPGNRASAIKALRMCRNLPDRPAILDLGCGVGAQTLHLADLTNGLITALDNHAPSIETLKATVEERGLSGRILPVVGDMGNPGLAPGSFDLVWSEGALYNLGMERALRVCSGMLRPGGYLVFTEPVWLRDDPPPDVKASFDFDYPSMGRTEDVLAVIDRSQFALVGHFTLPDEAWWEDFYTPMEVRIEEMRAQYKGDVEALAVLDQLAQEPAMHRRYADYYAYEFFVVRWSG